MLRMNKLASGVAASALMLAMASAVHAQETTAAMRGQVTNEAGEAVANATVVIVHAPTGTRSTTVTGDDGFYTARGLRVGGPYTVTVTAPGADPETTQVASIGLGDPAQVDVTLFAAGTVEEVVVTAQAVDPSAGPSSRFTDADIANLPSISRDLKDTFRADPFISLEASSGDAVIAAGTNYRFNSIVIDGVRQNDDFGLNLGGYPTQRSPINLDAVEAVSVNLAPYSVVNNDFQGAQINVVTKGGSNKFEGSIYREYTDDSMIGKKVRGAPLQIQFKEDTWGATVGGPIWRDRAFFFASYEKFEGVRPFQSGTGESGRGVSVIGTTNAQVQQIQDILATTYSFDFDRSNSILGGGFSTLLEEDEKKQARFDFNITQDHRLRLTWQNTFGNRLVEGERSTNTGSPRRLSLLSTLYNLSDELTTMTAQLNSDWTENLSTEVFYNKKEVVRGQVPQSGCADGPSGTGDEACEFGSFQTTVVTSPQTVIGAGPDISRHANELETETTTFGGRVFYTFDGFLGSHEIMLGAEREDLDIYNLFAQRSEGDFEFTSIANLAARTASRLRYQNALVDVNGDGERNELDAAAAFTIGNTAIYIEDNWQIHPDFSITPGIRFEEFENPETPTTNVNFNQRYQTLGITNSSNLDGKTVTLPRLAFQWDAPADITVKGGIGLFSGGTPNVYISNNYSTTGSILATIDCQRNADGTLRSTATCSTTLAAAALNNVNGFDIPLAVEAALNPSAPGLQNLLRTSNVNALDPNFEIPQSWKTSLTLIRDFDFSRFRLGDDWRFTADYLYSRVKSAPYVLDLRGGLTRTATAPDGRPIYRRPAERGAFVGATGEDFGSDLYLTNTDIGRAHSLALAVQKRFDNGLDFSLSHTRVDADDAQAFTSSTASSNYGLYATADPITPVAATSNYEIKYSTKLTASWGRAFFGDYETRITAFAESRAGLPYSITFNPISATGSVDAIRVFGDISNGRQLIYVPTGTSDPLVGYEARGGQTAADTAALLDQFINGTELGAYRGRIAPRNAFRSPDVNRVDIRIQQELPAFFPGGARIRAFFDIENLGNLINDEWGVLEQVGFPYIPSIVDVRLDPANPNRYLYSNFRKPTTDLANADAPTRSVWQMKVGLKYQF